MTFQVKEPILVVGLGGAGSKLAIEAKNSLNSDFLIISNDPRDLEPYSNSIKISTDSIVNPSVQFIRGSTFKVEKDIRTKVSQYSTVVLVANLAGKTGAATAPVIASICKELDKNTIVFAIMPFKYENDRIFNAGIALKRVEKNSDCTVVLDNDSLLESNPDLTVNDSYKISNSAILHVIKSLSSTDISNQNNIISTSKEGQQIEESLRDSLKMLYENAPPNTVKRAILYVVGGNNIPVGVIKSISSLTSVISNDLQVDVTTNDSDEAKIVMLSSVQSIAKFEKYDPLGIIPHENTLDWNEPACSIDLKIDLYQLE